MDTWDKNLTLLIQNYTEESVDNLNRALDITDSFDASVSKEEHINELFRVMHSLKGNSSLLGFVEIKELCHNCEAILSIYREDISKCAKEGISIIKETVLFVKSTILGFSDQETVFDKKFSDHLLATINQYLKTIESKDQNQLWDELMEDVVSLNSLIPRDASGCHEGWKLLLEKLSFIHEDLIGKHVVVDSIVTPTENQQNPKEQLATILSVNNDEDFSDKKSKEVFSLLNTLKESATDNTRIFVDEALLEYNEALAVDGFTSFLSEILLTKIQKVELKQSAKLPQKNIHADVQNLPTAAVSRKSIRVDEENLDNLLNQISDLVIANEVYSHIQKRLDSNMDANDDLLAFKKNNEVLSNITSRIQQEISSIRKVSLKQMSYKARQIVEKISQEQHKKINLFIRGDDLLIDKSLFDAIQDPFVHLVRNASDHGIENKEVRKSLKKPEEGRVDIILTEDSENFFLTIQDDGKGVNPDEIVQKALKKGLITREASLSMNNQQKLNLLTLPGFSTIESATEFSGRGVGLDIVRKNIASLNGSLEIESKQNHYTLIKISLPKNVFIKIILGFLVACNEVNCILPMASVGESFEVDPSQITKLPNGDECLKRHNKVYHVKRLSVVLGLTQGPSSSNKNIGIIVDAGVNDNVLLVDEVLGTQQVVAKDVKGLQMTSSIINSFSILGNEKIAVMLDVDEIFKN